ncbi:hypothetical protein ASN18_2475 [Candidatus Magnetominusculus xianensis]|uniref:Uncharacterized protein n=1 Tax=Candidatus Magnetominusculus xianensis TaxID=1748249 RepID=A0ABR5SE25_9BACT|nr:hypothetical protein ASN18_2475 [Candidatus Magnetominusculus xianensis]
MGYTNVLSNRLTKAMTRFAVRPTPSCTLVVYLSKSDAPK